MKNTISKVYYNEWDSYAAQWLRNLIDAGHLPYGDVDERSITDVEPEELTEYTQWHFFAGIGGWSLAARLAGVSDDERIVTGSPPCQPFSSAGRHRGYEDERHLAPHWLRLVAAIRPTWVFAEQVAAAIKKDDWLDDLLNELEAEGYATGAVVLPGCSVGAPHIRQRLWVAARLEDTSAPRPRHQPGAAANEGRETVDGQKSRLRQRDGATGSDGPDAAGASSGGRLGNAELHGYDDEQEPRGKEEKGRVCEPQGPSANGGVADPNPATQGVERPGGVRLDQRGAWEPRVGHWSSSEAGGAGDATEAGWDAPDWLWCRDRKWRPVESGTFPLAHGLSSRVGRLRAYGNAIVPQVAAEVIKEAMSNE